MTHISRVAVLLALAVIQPAISAQRIPTYVVLKGSTSSSDSFQGGLYGNGMTYDLKTTNLIAAGDHGQFYNATFTPQTDKEKVDVVGFKTVVPVGTVLGQDNPQRDITQANLLAKEQLPRANNNNINRILDSFEYTNSSDGKLWQGVLQDSNSGPDLKKFINNQPKTNDDIKSIFPQIAGAIAAAHSAGVFHFHPKPPNVVFTGGDKKNIKLVDFDGITVDDPLNEPGVRAPKYSTGSDLNNRENFDPKAADVFHLGLTLCIMLEGKDPFKGNDPQMATVADPMSNAARSRLIRANIPHASEPAVKLLTNIFNPPNQRMSSTDLSTKVSKMKKFVR